MKEIELLKIVFSKYHFPEWLLKHSINAAAVISITQKWKTNILDNKMIVGALLHDLGRIVNSEGSRHTIEGYKMLACYDESIARYCITHSFPTKDANDYQGKNNCSYTEILFMNCILKDLSLEDKLIILSDCYATSSGIVMMNERFNDFDIRYPARTEIEQKNRNKIRNAYYDIENDLLEFINVNDHSTDVVSKIEANRALLIRELISLLSIREEGLK